MVRIGGDFGFFTEVDLGTRNDAFRVRVFGRFISPSASA
jgi:hypothetical protein